MPVHSGAALSTLQGEARCPHLPHSSAQVLVSEQDGKAAHGRTKGHGGKVDSSQASQIINKCFSGLVSLPAEAELS